MMSYRRRRDLVALTSNLLWVRICFGFQRSFVRMRIAAEFATALDLVSATQRVYLQQLHYWSVYKALSIIISGMLRIFWGAGVRTQN